MDCIHRSTYICWVFSVLGTGYDGPSQGCLVSTNEPTFLRWYRPTFRKNCNILHTLEDVSFSFAHHPRSALRHNLWGRYSLKGSYWASYFVITFLLVERLMPAFPLAKHSSHRKRAPPSRTARATPIAEDTELSYFRSPVSRSDCDHVRQPRVRTCVLLRAVAIVLSLKHGHE